MASRRSCRPLRCEAAAAGPTADQAPLSGVGITSDRKLPQRAELVSRRVGATYNRKLAEELMMVDRQPVVYLDIDDVLVRWEGRCRSPAPGAADFVRFLRGRAEVRWISSWCPSGNMREDRLTKLGSLLSMSVEELKAIKNPLPFNPRPHGRPPKHEGIDFSDPRPWYWIEDESLHQSNLEILRRRGFLDRFIPCNTSRQPDDLQRVRAELEARLDYSTRLVRHG